VDALPLAVEEALMPLTMKDITDACAALGRFRYEAGPYGVSIPPPGKSFIDRRFRIEPLSGIGGPGRWCIKRLPDGAAISGTIETKKQLRRALREWLAEEEYGPRPAALSGYEVYARNNGVRTAIGMANAIVWVMRRKRAPRRK
jgi:hypothetical protein